MKQHENILISNLKNDGYFVIMCWQDAAKVFKILIALRCFCWECLFDYKVLLTDLDKILVSCGLFAIKHI